VHGAITANREDRELPGESPPLREPSEAAASVTAP
jgi:hypothetical protein